MAALSDEQTRLIRPLRGVASQHRAAPKSVSSPSTLGEGRAPVACLGSNAEGLNDRSHAAKASSSATSADGFGPRLEHTAAMVAGAAGRAGQGGSDHVSSLNRAVPHTKAKNSGNTHIVAPQGGLATASRSAARHPCGCASHPRRPSHSAPSPRALASEWRQRSCRAAEAAGSRYTMPTRPAGDEPLAAASPPQPGCRQLESADAAACYCLHDNTTIRPRSDCWLVR